MKTPFFTGKGDDGVSRVGAKRASKRDPALAVLGMADELNSLLGLCRVEAARVFPAHGPGDIAVDLALKDLQNGLFIVQAELAGLVFGPGPSPAHRVTGSHVASLESLVRDIEEKVPPLSQFVMAGGTELAARLDFARTVARRTERGAVGLSGVRPLPPPLLAYLNRFSSALFALARYANWRAGILEEHPRYE